LSRYKTLTIAVAGAHVTAMLVFYIAYRPPDQARPADSITVNLRNLPDPAALQAPKSTMPAAAVEPAPPIVTPETSPTAAKQKYRARTPEEIRQSADPWRQPEPPTPQPTVQPEFDSSDLRQQLLDNLNTSDTAPAPLAVQHINDEYLQQIRTRVYQAWQQPHRTLTGGQMLQVTVSFDINSDGSIAHRLIIKSSKNKIMDQSVAACLKSVDALPPIPPELNQQHLSIQVIMQLAP
jgi:TonB family protein